MANIIDMTYFHLIIFHQNAGIIDSYILHNVWLIYEVSIYMEIHLDQVSYPLNITSFCRLTKSFNGIFVCELYPWGTVYIYFQSDV